MARRLHVITDIDSVTEAGSSGQTHTRRRGTVDENTGNAENRTDDALDP